MAKQELSKPSDEKLKGVATKRDLRRAKEKDRVLTPEDRGHPDWAYYGAHQEVAKLLQQIYQYEGRGMSDVFPTFVECCHAALDALPEFVAVVMDGERDLRKLVQIADTEESRRLTAGWRREESLDLMAQAFAILLEATKDPNGSLTYADVVGSTYMDVFPYRRKGQFKDTRAQFFTPWPVAECMAKMSLMDAEAICIERLKQAAEGDPLAEALALMTTAFPEEAERFFFERLLPYAVDKAEPFTVADICCGSGVMLLAAAKQFPRWAIDSRLVQFYAVDIDPLCVEMCRLNMRLYGIEPLALQPVDALRFAELKALPWPYGELYTRAVTDTPPGRAHWEEGVDFARVQHAEHHQRLFEEKVTRAEALARGLGLQRLTVGPIEWWFDGEGNFCWRRLETSQVDGWEQGRLPGCDIDNEEISK